MYENPHVGLVFVDFLDTTVGLHVNGKARICEADKVPDSISSRNHAYEIEPSMRVVERWIIVEVEEAYIHCSKHVPRLQKLEKPISWGTDDPNAKADDFFLNSTIARDSDKKQ